MIRVQRRGVRGSVRKSRVSYLPESFERNRATCELLRAGRCARDKSAVCRIKNDHDALSGICQRGCRAGKFAKELCRKFEFGGYGLVLWLTGGRLHYVDCSPFPALRRPISGGSVGFRDRHPEEVR